jgi:serine/threonine protein phosphatase PrpC
MSAAIIESLQMSHEIEVSTAVEQNGKGQDQPFSGKTASGKQYFGIWDGHGSNGVIGELRAMMKNGKLANFMERETPIEDISEDLLNRKIVIRGESSGSTMNCGILENNILTCMNCGDSRMFLFRNGELIFKSEEHYWNNSKEKDRLGHLVSYDKSQDIKVISEKEMIAVYSEYVRMKNGNQLASTQAIGHNNNLKPAPDVFRFEIEPTDEIVAVCVSDGVTDMLIYDEEDNIREQDIRMMYEYSAEKLKDTIQERWLQPWDMITMNGIRHTGCGYSKSQCDDIGVTRFVMKPKL